MSRERWAIDDIFIIMPGLGKTIDLFSVTKRTAQVIQLFGSGQARSGKINQNETSAGKLERISSDVLEKV